MKQNNDAVVTVTTIPSLIFHWYSCQLRCSSKRVLLRRFASFKTATLFCVQRLSLIISVSGLGLALHGFQEWPKRE